MPPIESGLVVPGDAKALAVLDLGDDGWPGFLVSRTAKRRWRSTTGASRAGIPLRVVLQGQPGNPQAVGARVTAEYADGTTQTGEVCAGSGYYSQSTAALFFGSTDRNPLRRVRVRWPSGATTTSPDFGGRDPEDPQAGRAGKLSGHGCAAGCFLPPLPRSSTPDCGQSATLNC